MAAFVHGIAFLLRSERAERRAGLFVVAAIFISAVVAGAEAVRRLIDPAPPDHLWALAAAGAIGYVANYIAAKVRLRAGGRLDSAALVADGHHARADAYVALAVIASAAVVAIGLPIADPLIGLAITIVILRITRQSWATVRGPRPRSSLNPAVITSKSAGRRAARPLPMSTAEAKGVCCEEKYGFTRPKRRRRSRCPEVWQQS